MPFYISSKTFKQQAKTIVKAWPFPQKPTLSHVRQVLSQVYGYRSNHHYQKLIAEHSVNLTPCTQASVIQHYPLWVQRLAKLAPMNEIQAKKLIYKIWLGYLQNNIDTNDKLYCCYFQFFGDCTIFLDESLRTQIMPYHFDDKPTVKDAIEAIGIPHTEVLAIEMTDGDNKQFIDFTHKLTDNIHIKVYSTPNYHEISHQQNIIKLPYKPQKLTFLLDVHLGGLARYLRMAGFDCLFETTDYGDAFLAELSHNQELILLTRDINLLKRSKVKYGRWVRNVLPEKQFHEIIEHYQLYKQFKPFQICIKCNGEIKAVSKQSIKDKVPVAIFATIDDFKQCQQCQQVYWQGSHYAKIEKILANAQQQGDYHA